MDIRDKAIVYPFYIKYNEIAKRFENPIIENIIFGKLIKLLGRAYPPHFRNKQLLLIFTKKRI